MGVSDITKYVTFLVLNVVICTGGAILLAFGAILQRDENKGIKSFAQLSIGGFSIGVGVLVMLVAAHGSWAIFKKKPHLLTSYAILMIIMFIIQIVMGAIALGSVNNTKCEMDEEMEKHVKNLFLKSDDKSLKLINKVQKSFQCCGVNGPVWWTQLRRTTPPSCCPNQQDPCQEPYTKGCAKVYTNAIEKNVAVIGGVAIGFCVVEIVAAILAWYCRLAIKKSVIV